MALRAAPQISRGAATTVLAYVLRADFTHWAFPLIKERRVSPAFSVGLLLLCRRDCLGIFLFGFVFYPVQSDFSIDHVDQDRISIVELAREQRKREASWGTISRKGTRSCSKSYFWEHPPLRHPSTADYRRRW